MPQSVNESSTLAVHLATPICRPGGGLNLGIGARKRVLLGSCEFSSDRRVQQRWIHLNSRKCVHAISGVSKHALCTSVAQTLPERNLRIWLLAVIQR
jgi:hypothetical protein